MAVFSSAVWVLLVIALLVLVVVWAEYFRRKHYIEVHYYDLLKKSKLCPNKKATAKAARCATDAYIKKYGVFSFYSMLKHDAHRVDHRVAKRCLRKYCP